MSEPLSSAHKDEYYHALGRFIDRFATIETFLQTLLWFLGKFDPKTAKAVLSRVRVNESSSYIKRLAEIHDELRPHKAEFDNIFQQLSLITDARNSIIHYGAKFSSDELTYMSTDRTVAMPGREKTYLASPTVLSEMVADLEKIHTHLVMFFVPDNEKGKFAKMMESSLNASWRYKPPSQDSLRRKNPNTN